MGQRDRAEKKAKGRHGSGAWHPSKAAEKAQRATVNAAKRARRRLDDAIVEQETARVASDLDESDLGWSSPDLRRMWAGECGKTK